MGNPVQKNPGIAAVLSFLFTGLGQLYNGQIFKGLVMIFCSALSIFIFLLGALLVGLYLVGKTALSGQISLGIALIVAGILLTGALGIYSIINAYKVAQEK